MMCLFDIQDIRITLKSRSMSDKVEHWQWVVGSTGLWDRRFSIPQSLYFALMECHLKYIAARPRR